MHADNDSNIMNQTTTPTCKRGIRILSLDGGGMRALIMLEFMKAIEHISGKKIYELFDLICGTSAGGLVAMGIAKKFSIDQIENLCKEMGKKVFTDRDLINLGLRGAMYKKTVLETLMRSKEGFGEDRFMDLESDPKICVVSALNGTTPNPFLFRNYEYGSGKLSRFEGSSQYKLWEAVRATSAAPFYFEPMKLDHLEHRDGGLVANNPSIIAYSEALTLWPDRPIECLVSLGTGCSPGLPMSVSATDVMNVVTMVIDIATSPELIHEAVQVMMPSSIKYYRFNPQIDPVRLDETDSEKLKAMQLITRRYIRERESKLEELCELLLANMGRIPVTRIKLPPIPPAALAKAGPSSSSSSTSLSTSSSSVNVTEDASEPVLNSETTATPGSSSVPGSL